MLQLEEIAIYSLIVKEIFDKMHLDYLIEEC